ncbi:MAG: hypothetical protein QXU18_00010 [Thermoplasmatales archaeon]
MPLSFDLMGPDDISATLRKGENGIQLIYNRVVDFLYFTCSYFVRFNHPDLECSP